MPAAADGEHQHHSRGQWRLANDAPRSVRRSPCRISTQAGVLDPASGHERPVLQPFRPSERRACTCKGDAIGVVQRDALRGVGETAAAVLSGG